MLGVISLPDSWFLPIQFRDSDLSMFVNSTVIKRQANFSYSKKYTQHFLLQAFFLILMFSRFKHQNYVSFTTRVSETIRRKAVALVSAWAHCCGGAQNCIRFPALAKRNRPINNFYWGFLTVRMLYKIPGLYFSNKIGVRIFLSKIKSTCENQFWLIFPDFRLLLFTSWAVARAGASRLVAVEVTTPIPRSGPALVQLSKSIR